MKWLALALLLPGCKDEKANLPLETIYYRETVIDKGDGTVLTITQQSNEPLPRDSWP